MFPSEALSIWKSACEAAGVRWSLYKDTLLCANGYDTFPETLKTAQVVVFARDLSTILDKVFPTLTAEWHLRRRSFARFQTAFCFSFQKELVLEVHVLHPVADPEAKPTEFSAWKRLRGKAKKASQKVYLIGRFFGPVKKLFRKSKNKKLFRTYDELIASAQTLTADAPYYTCALTEKDAPLLDAALFASDVTVTCGGVDYPAFSGYRTYLSDTYGDYENGLTDEIGVGLTVDEKAALKEHQQNCRTALAFIQEVAQEYNLRYYLLAGSVLGPVRHQGFIPWDDDIDLGIRIEDLEEFERVIIEELPKRLPPNFKVVQSGPNNPYPRMFSKLCCNGRCCMDFWPLVPTYIDGFRAKWTWYFAKIITKVHYKKINYKVTRFTKLVNPMAALLSDKMVMKMARHNERKYKKRKTPAYINLYSIYKRPKETIRREWLDTPATAMFDGLEIPVVGCTHEYLTHLYGNYMGFPPPWKRASRHVERF